MAYIYLIRNLVDGKGYVGQTTMSIKRRWVGHKSDSKRNHTALYRAMRKYGVSNFKIQEVVCCDPLLLNDLEKHYIQFYGTHFSTGHGYNLSEGGDNPPNHKGVTRSVETRARMAEAARNRPPLTDEYRKKMSETAKRVGYRPTPEAIKKSIVTNTGRRMPPHVAAILLAALTGVKKSPEELARRTATRRANAAKKSKAW